MRSRTGMRLGAVAALLALLAGCGGGGSNSGACISGSAATCAAGTNSSIPEPSAAQAANICTLEGVKTFTRAYLKENYLWYTELAPINAGTYTDVVQYFYDLLTPVREANGQRKDRFSFVTDYAGADTITTGAGVGYGVRFETDAQGRQRVAFVDAGSPAAAAGLARGGELVAVLTPGSPSWYPNTVATISFTYRDRPGAATRNITLVSAPVQEDPLPLVTTLTSARGKRVGYMLFNAHTRGAQDKLITAVQGLHAGVLQELVLDLRYNGGGFLYTAAGLATMISSSAADERVFEQLRFNERRVQETMASTFTFSPRLVVGETTYPEGSVLPRLGLQRVYVLATSGTCSASETIINGLRGIGIEVVIVGATTCGKPYGFRRKDNCGLSYFPIEFQGTNAMGFGDYSTGFAPTCAASDDFEHALGSPSETLLATALGHLDNGVCGAAPQSAPAAPQAAGGAERAPLRGKLLLQVPRQTTP